MINIVVESPLQKALKEEAEEKDMEMRKISLLEQILMKLERLPKNNTTHIGGSSC